MNDSAMMQLLVFSLTREIMRSLGSGSVKAEQTADLVSGGVADYFESGLPVEDYLKKIGVNQCDIP